MEIGGYRYQVRTLWYTREYVNAAIDNQTVKENKFKQACSNFRLFGLQMCDKFDNITEWFFVAIFHHLEGAGRLPVLNYYLQDINGEVTDFRFNEEVLDSLHKSANESYYTCLVS